MASGLLPSLREYAARYGLTQERLRAASPDVVVMHPGPMNEGVEIAADVAVDPRSVITAQVTNGVAVRMALLYLLAGAQHAGGHRVSEVADGLVLRGWAVDPASGREGAAELAVRDGVLERVTWLAGADADGLDPDGTLILPGPRGPARALPGARQRGRRDRGDRPGRGGARRLHDGLPSCPTRRRRSTSRAWWRGSGRRPRPPGRRCGSWSTARSRVGRKGETLAAAGRAGRRRRRRASPTTGRRSTPPRILRNALAYAGSLGLPIIDHPEDPTLTEGAEASEGYVATRPGPQGLAGRGRGRRGRAGDRDPGRRRARRPGRAPPPDARVHGGVAGARARGEGRRAAGHLRRHAAPHRVHRRVDRRVAALGLGGGRRRRARARPVDRRLAGRARRSTRRSA